MPPSTKHIMYPLLNSTEHFLRRYVPTKTTKKFLRFSVKLIFINPLTKHPSEVQSWTPQNLTQKFFQNTFYWHDTILCKNPTNTQIYVNTTLFTLSHSYVFQTWRVHPEGITDTLRQQGQRNTCPDVYIEDTADEIYQYSLRMAPWLIHVAG